MTDLFLLLATAGVIILVADFISRRFK